MKLYVVEYVTVPDSTRLGTFIESRSVEFFPGTVGSGKKDIDVSVNLDVPDEQSLTDAFARLKNTATIPKTLSIL
jgi:hypothetical protein